MAFDALHFLSLIADIWHSFNWYILQNVCRPFANVQTIFRIICLLYNFYLIHFSARQIFQLGVERRRYWCITYFFVIFYDIFFVLLIKPFTPTNEFRILLKICKHSLVDFCLANYLNNFPFIYIVSLFVFLFIIYFTGFHTIKKLDFCFKYKFSSLLKFDLCSLFTVWNTVCVYRIQFIPPPINQFNENRKKLKL